MTKKKPGMSSVEFAAYRERVARRLAAVGRQMREALAVPPPAVEEVEVEELPQELNVEVGFITATVEAGPDDVLGTEDDQVTLVPTSRYVSTKELKRIAEDHGIDIPAKAKKAELLELLKDYLP